MQFWSADGELLKETHYTWEHDCDFAALSDGRVIGWGIWDGHLYFWNSDGELLKKVEAFGSSEDYGGTQFLLILRNENILAFGREAISLFTSNGKLIAKSSGFKKTTNAIELDDGRIIVMNNRGWFKVLDEHLKSLYSYRNNAVNIRAMEQGRWLTWYHDGKIRIWHYDNYPLPPASKLLIRMELHNGNILVSDRESLVLFDEKGNLLRKLEGHIHPLFFVKLLSNHRIVSSPSFKKDSSLRLWSEDGSLVAVMEHSQIGGVQKLFNHRILTWSEKNGNLCLWSEDGDLIVVMEHEWVLGAIELENKQIISWGHDKHFRLWSPDGELIAKYKWNIQALPHVQELLKGRKLIWTSRFYVYIWDAIENNLVKWNAKRYKIVRDNRYILMFRDERVVLYSSDGEELITLHDHPTGAYDILQLSDGRWLSISPTVRIWDKDGQFITILDERRSEAFCIQLQNGNIVVWDRAKTGIVRIWSAQGELISEFRVAVYNNNPYMHIIELDDNRLLIQSRVDKLQLRSSEGELLGYLYTQNLQIKPFVSQDRQHILTGDMIIRYHPDRV